MVDYPGNIVTFTTKTDKVDLVEAAHMNKVQDEVKAIEQELGTDPAGSEIDLKTRLAVSIHDDGAIKKGTSFPGSPVAGQLFFRTDEDTLYQRNAANTIWESVGQTFSNVIFSWSGNESYSVNDHGMVLGTDLNLDLATTDANGYFYFATDSATYQTFLHFKFKKIAGISTITIQARLWTKDSGANDIAILNVDIGGQSNTVSRTSQTIPDWATSATIDVSGLTNGITYNGIVQLKKNVGFADAYCSAVTLIAS